MKKTIVLASLMLALLTLTALMPLVKAVTMYKWDGIHFVERGQILYPHPDRDYYDISITDKWSEKGNLLYHNQLDYATSIALPLLAPIIGATLGAWAGLKIGHPVIGAFVGAVLASVLTWVAWVYFLDECRCLWWWVSIDFMDWLTENAWWLGIKCLTNPTQAQNDILYAFLSYGYLRAGSVTFYDAVGAGNPEAKILTYIENHWEAPDPCPVDAWADMLGRLTDEYGNPMAKRTVALHVIQPDGAEFDYHGIVCDDNGVMRRGVHMTQPGTWQAWYWFGGDETYEGSQGILVSCVVGDF